MPPSYGLSIPLLIIAKFFWQIKDFHFILRIVCNSSAKICAFTAMTVPKNSGFLYPAHRAAIQDGWIQEQEAEG